VHTASGSPHFGHVTSRRGARRAMRSITFASSRFFLDIQKPHDMVALLDYCHHTMGFLASREKVPKEGSRAQKRMERAWKRGLTGLFFP
jgi:2-phospho-L-lactate guanylyltransferase (CobY/MobA/RfbA family)